MALKVFRSQYLDHSGGGRRSGLADGFPRDRMLVRDSLDAGMIFFIPGAKQITPPA